jgi:transcriptional regulator with XRE-family HTH domain
VSDLGTQATLRSEQGHTVGHDIAYRREAERGTPLGTLDCFPQTDRLSVTLPAMKIGDRIRQARQAAGLNQRELAAAVGVSHGIVGQWESHRKNPGTTNILKIAEVTLVDPAALTRDMPGVDGVLVKDTRQITMLRRFVLLSPRQQENLLELLGMAANIEGSPEQPCHAPQSEIPTRHRGRTQPR